VILDLTMELDENTPPYPAEGEPRFFRRLTASHDTGGFQVTELKLGTHLGTHVDAPLHSLPGGRSVAGVELNRFFGPAVCLAVSAERGGGAVSLAEVLLRAGDLIRKGDILVISTGWEERAGSEDFFRCPPLADDTGALLDRYGLVGIGVDMPSVGDIHADILGRGMSLIENLVNLKPLVGRRFLLSALPLRIPKGDGSPVRACAMLPEDDTLFP